MATLATFDPKDLEAKVKAMYRKVAEDPRGEFHFEMGRALAERLGYAPGDLDRIPAEAIESFAGVGYYFDLADLKDGETVVDLGSGSGMDTFVAALKVGPQGHVIGIDMTDAQLDKAERLRAAAGLSQVAYRKGYIDKSSCADASADVVISNGVINLAPDKASVFREAGRILKPGGRLAIADIVTEAQLPETVTCNADLWAACIGGGHAEGRLSSRDRGRGPAGESYARQRRLPVHFGQRKGRAAEVGREEHFLARREAMTASGRGERSAGAALRPSGAPLGPWSA